MSNTEYSFKSIVISIIFAGSIGSLIIFIPQLIWGRVIISRMLINSGLTPSDHVPDIIPLFIGCVLFSYLMMVILTVFAFMVFDRLASFRVGLIMGLTCFYVFCVATNSRIAIVLPKTLSSYLEYVYIFWWFGSMIMSTTGLYLLSKGSSLFSKTIGGILMILPIVIGGTSQGTELKNITILTTVHYYLILWIPLFLFWIISGSLWGLTLSNLRYINMHKYKQ